MCISSSVRERCVYLQWREDAGGDDYEQPEVHAEELTNHVCHISREDQQEETQTDGSEVFPQAPEGKMTQRLMLQLLKQNIFGMKVDLA